MKDEKIIKMLSNLLDDLKKKKDVITWTDKYFIPLEMRQKRAKIMAFSLIALLLINLGAGVWVYFKHPEVFNYLLNSIKFELGIFVFAAVIIGELFFMPYYILKKEYASRKYTLDFNKKRLIFMEGNKKETIPFRSDFTLPKLSVPEKEHYRYLELQRTIQENITDRTGFEFK